MGNTSAPIVIGIDYSMTSPGICILSGANVDIYSFNSSHVEKTHHKQDNFNIYVLPNVENYKSPIERFDKIARKILAVLNRYDLSGKVVVYMEGYSMASKGQVFHIAENTAVLKHYLYQIELIPKEISPATLKKYATGSGRAEKQDLHDKFLEETEMDLKNIFTPNRQLGSPVTDLIDAYYIACYARVKG